MNNNNKSTSHNKAITVGVIIAALVIAAIWFQSCFSVKDSTVESHWFLNFTKSLLEPIFGPIKIDGNGIRKVAHVIEFFILGAIMSILMVNGNPLSIKFWHCKKTTPVTTKLTSIRNFAIRTVICLVTVTLVACTDEFIQIFSGRGSRVSDIILDCIAGATAILTVLIVRLIIASYNKWKKSKTPKHKKHTNIT